MGRKLQCVTFLLAAMVLAGAPSSAQIPEFQRQWSVRPAFPIDSTPAIAEDGTLYFGTFDGQLWAVDAEGKPKWTFTTGFGDSLGIEIRSSPAVADDGTIYFGSRDRKVYALTPEGEKKWEFTTGAWVDSSPAVAVDGTVYIGSWDKHLYALSPDGTQKWRFATEGPVVSSPAIGLDGTIYFGSHDGGLYALKQDGTLAWKYATGGQVLSSPAIGGKGEIYITSVSGYLHAVQPDGTGLWKTHTGGFTTASPCIGMDGNILVGVNKEVWSITPEGKVAWKRPVTTDQHQLAVECTPLPLTDGTIVIASRVGWISIIDGKRETVKGTHLGYTGYASPVASRDGLIYFNGLKQNDGYYLFALRNAIPMAKTPWPKFRGNLRNTGRTAL